MCTALVSTALLMNASASYGALCADVDANGSVSVSDGVNVLRAAAGLASACSSDACDVDGNGAVTVTDGVQALRAAAGLPSSCLPIAQFVQNVRGARRIAPEVLTDETHGVLEVGVAPVPLANARQTIAELEGPTQAIAQRTSPFAVPYDVGTAASRSAASEPPTLIVAATHGDGSPIEGFFEVPLTSESAADAFVGVTFPSRLGGIGFALKFATRFLGVVSAYRQIAVTPKAAADRIVRFLEATQLDLGGPAEAPAVPRAVRVSADGHHAYVSSQRITIMNGSVVPSAGPVTICDRDEASGGLRVSAVTAIESDGPVVMSPDGVYAYATLGGTIQIFARDSASGSLEPIGSMPSPDVGLFFTLALSPDGNNVYASGLAGADVFARDAATGLLSYVTTQTEGITEATVVNALTVSPDGKTLYAVRSLEGIAVFSRDATTGTLHFEGVHGMPLFVPADVVVSGDGRHVYTASGLGGAVAALRRDVSTGTLTDMAMHTEDVETHDEAASGLSISPDGSRLYVTRLLPFSGKLVVFDRAAASGDLAFVESKLDGVHGVAGLANPSSVTVSPDSAHVYVPSGGGTFAGDLVGIFGAQ